VPAGRARLPLPHPEGRRAAPTGIAPSAARRPPAITALGGAAALTIGKPFNGAVFYEIWLGWWLSDSGGTLFLAAAAILWLTSAESSYVTGTAMAVDGGRTFH
jgi:NAD(P)-dependent dehydrogenase (short-subunit alcohol dehydrogenase family)